jgi:hypothetical protein
VHKSRLSHSRLGLTFSTAYAMQKILAKIGRIPICLG